MPICMIILSMSAEIAIGFSRNLTKIPIRLFKRSGPHGRFEFSDSPLNFDAALATRRTLFGLFAL